jgi:Sec-independent protein translocase protein TatA
MGSLSIWHWVVVAGVIGALFMPARFARNMKETGKAIKELKKEE